MRIELQPWKIWKADNDGYNARNFDLSQLICFNKIFMFHSHTDAAPHLLENDS